MGPHTGHRTDEPCIQGPNKPGDNGYVRERHRGEKEQSHRVAWERVHGPISPHQVIDHLCRNRACVNPKHLEPVTQRENVMRGEGRCAINARKEVCPFGHRYSGDNLRYDRRGGRYCKECKRVKSIERRARQKAQKDRPGDSLARTGNATASR